MNKLKIPQTWMHPAHMHSSLAMSDLSASAQSSLESLTSQPHQNREKGRGSRKEIMGFRRKGTEFLSDGIGLESSLFYNFSHVFLIIFEETKAL